MSSPSPCHIHLKFFKWNINWQPHECLNIQKNLQVFTKNTQQWKLVVSQYQNLDTVFVLVFSVLPQIIHVELPLSAKSLRFLWMDSSSTWKKTKPHSLPKDWLVIYLFTGQRATLAGRYKEHYPNRRKFKIVACSGK